MRNPDLKLTWRGHYIPVFTGILVLVLATGLWSLGDKPAPDITFPLIDGRELRLEALNGQAVLITFWATTCLECRREIPDLIALYNELGPSGLEIIAVAMPYDPPNRVLETARLMNLPYPVALDIHGDAVRAFGNVEATPASFLISTDSRIVMRHTGAMDIARLRKQILRFLLST